MEEKGQTGIQLNHLFLNIKTTVKPVSGYKMKCSLHLLFCVLGEDFTGEAGHHVQDVIIELFREPGSIDILKDVPLQTCHSLTCVFWARAKYWQLRGARP